MADKSVIDFALTTLSAAYDKRIDETRRAIYKTLLGDIPNDALTAAVKHVIGTCKFFPSVAEIRDAATSLGRMAYSVPSSAEAWSELVNRAHPPRKTFVACSEYIGLKNEAAKNNPETYWDDIRALRNHEEICDVCQLTTNEYRFSHPLVEQVARRLGWPDRFWSDEIGVDRGRFIKTYEAEITRLSGEAQMLPEVRNYVNEQRALLEAEHRAVFDTGERKQLDAQLRRLTMKMEE